MHKKTTNNATLRNDFLIAGLLAFCILLLFFPLTTCDFVNYDDDGYVSGNARVLQGLTGDGIAWAFQTGEMSNWHPLTWLSYMLDVEIFGAKPSGFHFTNIFFHALNTLLLFLVLQRITGARWPSAFVAALFALHPAHVESVAWISERKDVLSTFCWLLTIWAYARYVEARNSSTCGAEKTRGSIFFYSLALVFFTLGLMSKPMVVTLPFALLLLDFWPLRRIELNGTRETANRWRGHGHLLLEKIPFFILSFIASVVTFIVQKEDGAFSSLAAVPMTLRFENAFVSYVRYLGKMFWPTDLSIVYPHVGDWPSWQVGGAVLLLLTISAITIPLARHRPYFLVGWFWFLGTLVPVIGIVKVGSQAMADRYTYVPFIGLFVAVAWGSLEVLSRWKVAKATLGTCAGLILLACAGLTKNQIAYWKDTESLFDHATKVTGKNAVAHEILAGFFVDRKRYDKAIQSYQNALQINPHSEEARNNLGYALSKTGSHEEAIAQYRIAVKISPGYGEAHNNLGISLAALGKIDEAIHHYKIALARQSKFAKAHNNLGIALMMRGHFAEAVEHFRSACIINPDYMEAVNGLAWILATHPNPKFRDGFEAVRLASHAVGLSDGKDAGIFETLAAAYAESGDFANALKFVQSGSEMAKATMDEQLISRLQSEWQLYSAQQPYRDASLKEN